MDSPASTSAAAGPSVSVPPASTGPTGGRTKSKSYGTTLAKEGDVQKYRAKYKDLKIKVKEIEKDNDKINLKIQKAKRAIERVRMERAIIYERLVLNPIPPSVNAAPPPSLESFLAPPPQPATTIKTATPSADSTIIQPEPLAAPAPALVSADAPPATGFSAPEGLVAAGGLGLVDVQALPGAPM